MRLVLPIVLLVIALAFSGGRVAGVVSAAQEQPDRSIATVDLQQPVDDHEDSRVPVMLVVFGIAAFVVVGVGVAGYVLRRRLGKVPWPADDAATGHH